MTYRGWQIEKIDGTQVNYKTAGGGLSKRLGIGTHRKFAGYEATAPDGMSKCFDRLKDAKEYIDRYEGA